MLLQKVSRGFRLPFPQEHPRFFAAGQQHDETGETEEGLAMEGGAERTPAESASGVSVWKGNDRTSEVHTHGPWEDGVYGVTREDVVRSSGETTFETESAAPPVLSGGHDALPAEYWTIFQTDGSSPVSVEKTNEDGDLSPMISDKTVRGDEGAGFNPSSFEFIDGARFRRKAGYKEMISSVAVQLVGEQQAPMGDEAASKDMKSFTREHNGHPAGGDLETGTATTQAWDSEEGSGIRVTRLHDGKGGEAPAGDAPSPDEEKVYIENSGRHEVDSPLNEKPGPPATETLRSILSDVFPGPFVRNEPPLDASVPAPDVTPGPGKGTVRIGPINIHVKGREEPREENWPSAPTYTDHVITEDWEWACRYGR
jgi:hypothetical protein